MPVTLGTPPFSLTSGQRAAISNGVALAAMNNIRQLIAGAITNGTDGKDIYAEAYIDSDGRNNSVSGATATFNTNYYGRTAAVTGSEETKQFNGGSLTSVSFTIVLNQAGIVTQIGYDGQNVARTITISDGVSSASKSQTAASGTFTFTPSDYSGKGYLAAGNVTISIASAGTTYVLANQTYDGTLFDITNQPVIAGGGTMGVKAIDVVTNATITHTIAAGKFPAGITNACFKTLVKNYESGQSIQYKLTSAVDDSGYINDGETGTFTAFAQAPTALIVKLTAKSTNPTNTYPAIYGVGGVAW